MKLNSISELKSPRSASVTKWLKRFLSTSAYVTLVAVGSVSAMPSLAAPNGLAEVTIKTNPSLSRKDANLLAKFRANNWSDYQPPNFPQLKAAMKSSTVLREEVLQRFQGATDNVQRDHFSLLLRAASIPGFPTKALAWARDSQDVKTRMSAFTFISMGKQTPEVEALFLNALMNEKDAQVLGQVVLLGLRPLVIPEGEMADQVVNRLHDLTRHESAEVRFGSLQRLAEWDKKFRFFPDDLMRLLNDSEPMVRIAAIGATSISEYTSEPLKLRLLEILGDPKEIIDVRGVAALNIERFEFKGAEQAQYKSALAALEKAAAEPVASLKH